jgi:L-alanine-DL-glutamate epimerase-like enolase superfamily enzyme
MKISDLEFSLVEIPHGGGLPPMRSLLLCLTTDSGLEGWGEAPLDWRPAELAERRRALLPALAGRSIFDIAEILEIDALHDPPLACAVETAAWDLIGRCARQPLCHLLGGDYRQHIPLAVRLPCESSSDAEQAARELAEHGFHSQIVTATGDVDRDLATFNAVADAASDRAAVQLDGAGRFQPQSARELCSRIGDDRLSLLLDPLADGGLEAVVSLARQTNIPLALSDAIHSPRDVMAIVRCGAASHVVVNIYRVGGLTAARKCAAVAEAGGLSVSLSAEGSLGVSAAAMLHLAAATPALASGNQSDYYHLQDDLLAHPLEILDGMLTVPQSPGLGVDVDRAKLERFQVT